MSVPCSLLSLLYHGTVPDYRDEMHTTLAHGFERFSIDAAGFARYRQAGLPGFAAVRAAVEAVDEAAFEVRSGLNGARPKLHQTSDQLFELLAPLLAAEIAERVSEPDQNADPAPAHTDGMDGDARESLLGELYLLVYSRAFRASNPTSSRGFPHAATAVGAHWDAVLAARSNGGAPFTVLLPHVSELCRALASEFNARLWPMVW